MRGHSSNFHGALLWHPCMLFSSDRIQIIYWRFMWGPRVLYRRANRNKLMWLATNPWTLLLTMRKSLTHRRGGRNLSLPTPSPSPFFIPSFPSFSSSHSSPSSSQAASERKERNPRARRWIAGESIPPISDSISLIPPPISFPPLRPVLGRIWVAKIIDSRGSFRYLLFPFFFSFYFPFWISISSSLRLGARVWILDLTLAWISGEISLIALFLFSCWWIWCTVIKKIPFWIEKVVSWDWIFLFMLILFRFCWIWTGILVPWIPNLSWKLLDLDASALNLVMVRSLCWPLCNYCYSDGYDVIFSTLFV